jgi:TonB dependent receptor.
VRGFHLPRVRNAALTLPPSYLLEQTALSAFQGASISVNRRMSREVAFLVGYNVGRTRDDGSDFDEQPLDPSNIRRDWAPSRQHQLHRLSASGLFDLPADAMPKSLHEALENISIAPIFTIGSGRPLNALATTDLYRTGAYPISARPPGIARNSFLSPGTVNVDLRIMKTFPFHENRSRLQVGLEAFNLANHTNPIRVSPYYSYRGIVETLNARQLQFMIQFEY